MRIIIISNLFPPYVRGGAEMIAANTAKEFRDLGHDVTVISTEPPRLGHRRYKVMRSMWEGIRVLRFYPQNLYFLLDDHKQPFATKVFWHLFDAFSFYSAGVVRKLIKKYQPDIVITHNLKGIGLLIPFVIRRAGVPHVHTLHDVQLIEPSGLINAHEKPKPWYSRVVYAAYRSVTRALFESPRLVVSPTHWLLELHRADGFFPKSTTLVLPNPVEIADSLRAQITLPTPRFVFVGQLERHKGILELLRSIRALRETQDITVDIDIIGEGSLMAAVREEVGLQPTIRIHGRLPREKVVKILDGATALVFPSTCMENAPGAVLESLALGVPVLATEVGGVPEFVKENQTGWLVKPGDADELVRMIRHIIEHPKEVQMLKDRLNERKILGLREYCQLIIDKINTVK